MIKVENNAVIFKLPKFNTLIKGLQLVLGITALCLMLTKSWILSFPLVAIFVAINGLTAFFDRVKISGAPVTPVTPAAPAPVAPATPVAPTPVATADKKSAKKRKPVKPVAPVAPAPVAPAAVAVKATTQKQVDSAAASAIVAALPEKLAVMLPVTANPVAQERKARLAAIKKARQDAAKKAGAQNAPVTVVAQMSTASA